MERLARRVLGSLPAPLLALLASTLAQCRPLGRFPGWRFGIEEDTPTVAMFFRRWLWDHFRSAGIERPVRIQWFGDLQLDVVLGNDQSRCLYVGGSIEPNELAFVGRFLRPGMVAVDAGANEGWYSAFMAERVGAGGLVLAVEPSARERARLERNMLINGFTNVRVVSEGLAADAGHAVLHVADPEHNGQNTLGSFVYEGVKKALDVEIRLRRLDDLAGQSGRQIDLIKMDVEGAELAVLRGAERILRDSRPVILFELLDAALRAQNASACEVLEFLSRRGFSVLKFDAAGSLAPLSGIGDASSNLVAVPESRVAEVIARSRE
ncbi:MAG: FkbM family methyltransferase [Candidatus Parcubacteria bacterium]|nr:FkbM family methyltransferase [Burkholderiales bacterium]